MPAALTIYSVSAQQALLYKEQLTQDGLVVNRDYSWSYRPVKYNDWLQTDGDASCVQFEFEDQALASFYRLKWVK